MLASRLIKSCLFMLVALAPMVSRGGFIVDNFSSLGTASNAGITWTASATGASGGIFAGVTRTISVQGNASNDHWFNTASGKFSNVTTSESDGLGVSVRRGTTNNFLPNITVTYSGLSGVLTNVPSLILDFEETPVNFSLVSATTNQGSLTTSPFVGQQPTPGISPLVLFLGANPASINTLTLVFRAPINNGIVTFDSLTATPEPTSMLLFGSVAGAGFLVRRRWKTRKVANV